MRIQIRPDSKYSKYLAGFKPETETWIRFRPLVSINNFLHEGHEDHWGLVKGGGGEGTIPHSLRILYWSTLYDPGEGTIPHSLCILRHAV